MTEEIKSTGRKGIIKWDIPSPITKRVYVKGCMDIKNNISDILLGDLSGDRVKIGKCRISTDDEGLWANDIEYFVNEESLNKLLSIQVTDDKNRRQGTTELSLACIANDKNIIDKAEFSFLMHQLFNDDCSDIKKVLRDLKLESVLI